MIRHTARAALALLMIAAVIHTVGFAQPVSQLKVFYRDKTGGEKTIDADDLKATPGGYQVVVGGKVSATLSPDDIIRVDPGEAALPQVERAALLAQFKMEQDAAKDPSNWEKARVNWLELQKKAKGSGAQAKVSQFLEYRIAYTSAKVADATEDGWEEKAQAAQKLLNDYVISYQTGWEVWQATQLRCRLMLELGNPGEAAAMWAKTAKNASVPADLQREAALEEIDALIRDKQFAVAKDHMNQFPKGDATGPTKDRLDIYQAAIKVAETPKPNDLMPLTPWLKPLQDLVDAAKSPAVRAVGYNMIGEVCMIADRPREAMWAYLWVEVVYNHDRHEVAKAMARLVKSFEAQQDDERAKTYKDKLRRYRLTL